MMRCALCDTVWPGPFGCPEHGLGLAPATPPEGRKGSMMGKPEEGLTPEAVRKCAEALLDPAQRATALADARKMGWVK